MSYVHPCQKLNFPTYEFTSLQQVLFIYLYLLTLAYSKDSCNWRANFNIRMGASPGSETLPTYLYCMTPISLSKTGLCGLQDSFDSIGHDLIS